MLVTGIAPDFRDELLGNIQWRVLESEEQWHHAIIQQDADLPLKLTPEEYELVKLPGNLLLSGSAGTGKTTVALYRLLQSLGDSLSGRRLYVAYNPLLVSNAQEQFKRLVGKTDTEIDTIFQFKTLRDLCLEILQASGQSYIVEDQVTFQVFSELYRGNPKIKQYPTALAWDEIRSIIKGSQLSTDRDILSKKDYEKLGKRRSTVIPPHQRHEVYQLAEWYQKKLKNQQDERFDEIDLARKVLQLVKSSSTHPYQLIVCDEVQDFTELQLELLLQLSATDGKLFFAGDLHQMISPSGFRWEELRQKFYRGRREVTQRTLNFNFRSVGTLVNLANQVLRLRSRLLQAPVGDISQPAFSHGENARLIAATPETLKPALGQLNPGDAILVRTEAEREKFRDALKSTLIFTIEEAKGLEFDTVFLVEFFQHAQELWGRVFRNAVRQDKDTPHLQLELNLLYVGITRARRILNIWEARHSQIWSQPELTGCIMTFNSELVKDDRVEPTAEAWRERGLYYLKAEFYRQALECFEKSGDTLLQRKANAKLLVQQGEYSKAAEIFAEVEEWVDAARLFEKVEQWQRAARCWASAGNSKKPQVCEAYALEADKRWEEAAQKWEALERKEDAKRCWMNIPEKKAEYQAIEFEQKKQWLKAAQHYEIAGLIEKAQQCRAKILKKPTSAKQEKTRIVHFPLMRSMGKLYISSRGGWTPNDVWQKIGEARGHVSVPWNKKLKLEANKQASSDVSFLDALAPDDLYTIMHLNEVDDNGLVHIRRLTGLKSLDLRMSKISDAGLVNIQNLTSLIALGLSDTNLGDIGMENVKKLTTLKRLFLSNTRVGDSGLSYIQGLIELEDLNLTSTNVSDAGLDYLKNMRKLERLILVNTQVSEVGWHDLKRALSKCEILWMPHGSLFGADSVTNSDDEENSTEIANICLTQGKIPMEIDAPSHAIRDNCASAKDHTKQGSDRFYVGDYQGAIKDFNLAIRINPEVTIAYIMRGLAYSSLGNYRAAIDDYTQALKIDPIDAETYLRRGVSRYDLDDYEEAIEDYTQAIQLNPTFSEAYSHRGIVYEALENYESAIEDYTQAIQLNPNDSKAYNNRGETRSKTGDFQGALEDGTEAVRINPDFECAYNVRGLVRARLEDYKGAIEDWTQSLRIKPNNAKTLYNRGTGRFKSRDFQGAIQDFTQAMQKEPSNPDMYMNRGSAYASLGNVQRAINDYHRAADLYLQQGMMNERLAVLNAVRRLQQ